MNFKNIENNMNIVFLDAYTLHADDGIDLSPLSALGNVTIYEHTSPSQVLERCKDAEIIISNKVVIDKEIIRSCDHLQYIVVCATGVNNIDLQAARNRSIPVSNVVDYSTESVVQHTFALMLALINRTMYYHQMATGGKWSDGVDFCYYDHTMRELSGKTLGIVGYGAIGKRVAEIAAAFRMKVISYKRTPESEIRPLAKLVDLETLLNNADIVTLHLPLNSDSEKMINSSTLSLMKSHAFLINTSRGGLVDENDLNEALSKGIIGGAALDTLSVEPPPRDHILFNAPNCIITPHQAWASLESRKRLFEGVCANVESFLKGKALHVVNANIPH